MSSVILMLNDEKLLREPKAPRFYSGSCLPGIIIKIVQFVIH